MIWLLLVSFESEESVLVNLPVLLVLWDTTLLLDQNFAFHALPELLTLILMELPPAAPAQLELTLLKELFVAFPVIPVW